MSQTETWTVRRILQWTTDWLSKQGVGSPRLDGELLLAHTLTLRRLDLFLDPDRPLSPDELQRYKAFIKRRAAREPVAYIVGKKPFLHWELTVTAGVLIPRPETEHLVQAAQDFFNQQQRAPHTILDIGTGSGAILLALLDHFNEAQGIGIDISKAALACAQHNGEQLNLNNRAQWLYSHFCDDLPHESRFDLILSNPPYINSDVIPTLEAEVNQWEPRLALDGGVDGMQAYQQIIPAAVARLNPGGLLGVEIGHDQGPRVAALMQQHGLQQVVVHKDYAQHDRVVLGHR
ncbi:[protein release factor]-glutamine N5-methyltransferase [Magnetococcus marinus MC-1]|uniref:Release factor glutamine methyltransferase n=1 Tax=Magnetococcus marinus (strain ATCC BAA-1437 / JCM 17883 / MC-1) TaxID=156889 RepID=A0LDE7_MAGMM|nr:peptide chain release factor N(5)-glutamine methyltransferase [Magnetococcus marinus]ABK45990.1 [protein release factor]-glutamine N5-methyltransferase [Magnetococcus marinus MC-1]